MIHSKEQSTLNRNIITPHSLNNTHFSSHVHHSWSLVSWGTIRSNCSFKNATAACGSDGLTLQTVQNFLFLLAYGNIGETTTWKNKYCKIKLLSKFISKCFVKILQVIKILLSLALTLERIVVMVWILFTEIRCTDLVIL